MFHHPYAPPVRLPAVRDVHIAFRVHFLVLSAAIRVGMGNLVGVASAR